MAYMDFVKLYATDVKKTPEALLAQTPLSFPMSTLDRGEKFAQQVEKLIVMPPTQLRVLDVGCAYGGHSLALAQRGALVSGVDVSEKFIDYARANAQGVNDKVKFDVFDASGLKIRQHFPKGSFNLVILNDVLEHIYDTATLVDNLNHLLDENGVVMFKVPNGYSPRFVLSEGHRKIFALTILDPDCWFHLYPKRASIFYRPFSHFEAIFKHFGFNDIVLTDEENVLARFTSKKLRRQLKDIFVKAKEFEYPSPEAAKLIRERVVRFRDDFDVDLATRSEEMMRLKYGSYFYTGAAARKTGLLNQSAMLQMEGFPPMITSYVPKSVDADADDGEPAVK